MSASFDTVDNKLREADFFLGKFVAASRSILESQFYFSAFVTAARSVTFALQHVMADVDGFAAWYQERSQQLKDNELCRYFVFVRNEVQKQGSSPVSMWGTDGSAFFVHWWEDPAIPVPDATVAEASRQYMIVLAKLIYEVYRDFGHFVDPKVVYSRAGATKRGLSIEDLEEDAIGIRGWTSGIPLDERYRLLREQASLPHIDDILTKYIGHDRFGTA
jgi:hypothetical protein